MNTKTINYQGLQLTDLKLNFKAYFEIKKKFNIDILKDDESFITQLLDNRVAFEIFKQMFKNRKVTITDDDIYEIIAEQFDGEIDFLQYNMLAFVRCLDKNKYLELVEALYKEDKEETE